MGGSRQIEMWWHRIAMHNCSLVQSNCYQRFQYPDRGQPFFLTFIQLNSCLDFSKDRKKISRLCWCRSARLGWRSPQRKSSGSNGQRRTANQRGENFETEKAQCTPYSVLPTSLPAREASRNVSVRWADEVAASVSP